MVTQEITGGSGFNSKTSINSKHISSVQFKVNYLDNTDVDEFHHV